MEPSSYTTHGTAIVHHPSNCRLTCDFSQAFQGDSKYQVKLWDIAHQLDSNYKAVDTPSFMRRYDMDRRSVHVGRLVSHIEEKHLEDVFKVVGEIEEIRIIRQAERTYAFVQFKSATAPDAAVRKFVSSDSLGPFVDMRRERFVCGD